MARKIERELTHLVPVQGLAVRRISVNKEGKKAAAWSEPVVLVVRYIEPDGGQTFEALTAEDIRYENCDLGVISWVVTESELNDITGLLETETDKLLTYGAAAAKELSGYE